tara:strand:+ start:5489 stop:5737 length:249 start_codon:yes stop_codon:yes gene_type:complete
MYSITLTLPDFRRIFCKTKNYDAYKGIIQAYKRKGIAIKKLWQQGVVMIINNNCINARLDYVNRVKLTSTNIDLQMLIQKYL